MEVYDEVLTDVIEYLTARLEVEEVASDKYAIVYCVKKLKELQVLLNIVFTFTGTLKILMGKENVKLS